MAIPSRSYRQTEARRSFDSMASTLLKKAQAYGNVAKKFTAKLVAGKTVEVAAYDIDKYGRTVGVVTVGDRNVNRTILEAGLGWQYRKYCKAEFCESWIQLEEKARKAGIGLWKDDSPTPPWEWRKRGQESNAAVAVPGEIHGNSKSHVFHQASCKSFNCKNCVISFESRESALKAGYRPCGSCRP